MNWMRRGARQLKCQAAITRLLSCCRWVQVIQGNKMMFDSKAETVGVKWTDQCGWIERGISVSDRNKGLLPHHNSQEKISLSSGKEKRAQRDRGTFLSAAEAYTSGTCRGLFISFSYCSDLPLLKVPCSHGDQHNILLGQHLARKITM